MKAAVTTEDHGFDIVDVPNPVPGPDELVIRVAACGVCGSDIKAQPFMPAGMVMGHELGGAIPVNTHGGLLGEGYIHGVNNILEGVRQLRGTAANQAAAVEHVLVAAGRSAAILGRV